MAFLKKTAARGVLDHLCLGRVCRDGLLVLMHSVEQILTFEVVIDFARVQIVERDLDFVAHFLFSP